MRSRWYSSGTRALSRIWSPHEGQVIIGSPNCLGGFANADMNEPRCSGRPRFAMRRRRKVPRPMRGMGAGCIGRGPLDRYEPVSFEKRLLLVCAKVTTFNLGHYYFKLATERRSWSAAEKSADHDAAGAIKGIAAIAANLGNWSSVEPVRAAMYNAAISCSLSSSNEVSAAMEQMA